MRGDGEQPRKVVGELGDLFRSPVWSADGKQIAFLRGVYHPGEYGVEPQIEILDVTTNVRKVVMSHARFGPALAWIERPSGLCAGRNSHPARTIPTPGR